MKFLIVLLTFIYSCNTSVEENAIKTQDTLKPEFVEEDDLSFEDPVIVEIDSVLYKINLSPEGNYYAAKKKITKKQLLFRKELELAKTELAKDSVIKEAGKFIDEAILNSIIPFWYGTEWDFSGYTHKPNDGFVGCSYFVSTTLKHSGFNLNRYHLAQQNPENEAKSLQINDSLIEFFNSEDLGLNTKNLANGLYFVGLDNHVGYLLIRKNKAFFINSSYMPPLCVEIQYAESSEVFQSSVYYIVAIGNNPSLIEKWILGNEIAVVKRKK